MADHYCLIRISKWVAGDSAWQVVTELDPRSVEELSCDFRAYRVEATARVKLKDIGAVSSDDTSSYAQKKQAIEQDLRDRKGVLYRLDVYSQDTQKQVDSLSWPTGWVDGLIFWSGILKDVRFGENIELRAVGWTEYLQSITFSGHYMDTKISSILNDIETAIDAVWPGGIDILKRSGGTDANLKILEIGWKRQTVQKVLTDLSVFGNFFFGVSVSGYPVMESQSASEFRLVFFEPHFEQDIDASASALGYESNVFIDVENDFRVAKYDPKHDDSLYANEWEFAGGSLHIDWFGIISGHDEDQFDDKYIKVVAADDSGAFLWESTGFDGWSIVIVDLARRAIVTDKITGEKFKAGRLEEVPASLRTADSDTSFFILDYTESGVTGTFNVGEVPSPDSDLDLDLNKEALRYRLRPEGVRVQRTVKDLESQDATTGRETIVRYIRDDAVRGMLQAVLFAMQDRLAERMQSRSAQLQVLNWTRLVNGSDSQYDNLIGVSEGQEQVTLWGTTGNGGDNWTYGDDTRKAGIAKMMEIKRANCVWSPGGWDVTFDLGAAAVDLSSVIFSNAVRGRGRRVV